MPSDDALAAPAAPGLGVAAAVPAAILLAERAGLQLVRTTRGACELWDGRMFHFLHPEG
ncbi:MAG TPA: hypothetical protein VFY92_03000 [Hyphomicrobiaceae bacterium]|nr:hypothetical protein [Hyphomicrobiaceae bacterium]